MRLKQKIALLLTGIMLAGSIGMIDTTEVDAAFENITYTLTVPADFTITQPGWNYLGEVCITDVNGMGPDELANPGIFVKFEGGNTRTLKKTGDKTKTIGYQIYRADNGEELWAYPDEVDIISTQKDDSQEIGIKVEDYSDAEDGTYEDTINFITIVDYAN